MAEMKSGQINTRADIPPSNPQPSADSLALNESLRVGGGVFRHGFDRARAVMEKARMTLQTTNGSSVREHGSKVE